MRHLITKLAIAAMFMGFAKYGRAVESPTVKAPIDSMSIAQLEAAGDEARAQKDYEQAIRYFQAAIGKDRKNAVLYNKLGLANLKKEDLDQARLSFQKALQR